MKRETRVNKFKAYREQLMSTDSESLESFSLNQGGSRMRATLNDSSNILPMDQVMQKLCMDEDELKKVKKARMMKYLKPALFISGIAITLIILVVVGIILLTN